MKGYMAKIISTIRHGKYYLFPSSFSFYMLFALVPAFTILVLLLNILNLDIEVLYKYIYAFLPDGSSSSLIEFLSSTPNFGDGISIVITLIISLFVISRGILVFMNVSNTLYKHNNDINVVKKTIFSLISAITIMLSLVGIIVTDVLLSHVIVDYDDVFSFLKYLIIFILLCLGLTILYFLGSDKKIKIKHSFLGALCASFGIVIVVFLFNIYTAYLVNYESTYGPLSWLIVLLVLFRIISTFIYLGLIINVINYKEKRLVNTSR